MRALLIFTVLLLATAARAQDETSYRVDDDAARRVAASLVAVHCLGSVIDEESVGFAYGDAHHVLTTSWNARCRSALYVRVGEQRIDVSRARISSEAGAALLSLDEPLPASVVPMRAEAFVDPVRGEPIATFSTAWDGVSYEAPFGLVRTIVSGEDPTRFESQICSGAPVIDRHGHLLGMCRSYSEAGPLLGIDDIEAWLATEPIERPVHRRISLAGDLTFATAFGPSGEVGTGAVLGVTASFDDVFTLRGDVSLSVLGHLDDPRQDPPLGLRLSTGLYAGLRSSTYFERGPSLVLSLEVGASVGWENVPPGPTETAFRESLFVRPSIRAMARFGITEIGYELQLDPVDPSRSLHLLHLGWAIE